MRMPAVSPFASRAPRGRARPSPASPRADRLSAMFWNPATMTQMPGLAERVGAERHHAVFGEHARLRGSPSSAWAAPAIPPLTLGAGRLLFLAVQTGHVARPVGQFAVRPVGELSPTHGPAAIMRREAASLKTYNATPSIAYRINDLISVGVGVQIQYAKADLSHCVTAPCRRLGPLAESVGPRLGLRLHRRRHLDADADDDHRHWLSFRHQPEDQRHARRYPRRVASLRPSTPRSICPTSSALGCASA